MNAPIHKKLLILDEVGYLSLDVAQSALLFQVLSRQYDRNLATILTGNKGCTEWGEVFGGDPVLIAVGTRCCSCCTRTRCHHRE